MPEIEFTAPEYQQDARFIDTHYRFSGDEHSGWNIYRQGKLWMTLGPGYIALETLYCGVCATDLARRHLPFPLPQIIGHEVVGLYQGQPVALEINASHLATNHNTANCPWCRAGFDIHCPERLTLGIDRLPGGFSPWVLSPVNAIQPLPVAMAPAVGIFIEPFAAALKAVEVSPPLGGDDVAVLGPRRLGMLLIAALAGYRSRYNISFRITAAVRHQHLRALCEQAGADRVVVINEHVTDSSEQFDIVYDTTGKQAGFALALAMSRRIVHLKSTHGQSVQGLKYLTDMVINEQSIRPYKLDDLSQQYLDNNFSGRVYVSPSIGNQIVAGIKGHLPDVKLYQGEGREMLARLEGELRDKGEPVIPQFDSALVTTLDEVDHVLRPTQEQVLSLLKPGGVIYLTGEAGNVNESELYSAITQRHIQLHTSRCGSFKRAIAMLEHNPERIALLQNNLISHVLPLSEMEQAFALAADSQQSMKVVISTSDNHALINVTDETG